MHGSVGDIRNCFVEHGEQAALRTPIISTRLLVPAVHDRDQYLTLSDARRRLR